jgi:hypothetical protein
MIDVWHGSEQSPLVLVPLALELNQRLALAPLKSSVRREAERD